MGELYNNQPVIGMRLMSGAEVVHNDRQVIGVRALDWVPLAVQGVKVDCPANTDENILAAIRIPAGAMGPNGVVRVTHWWTVQNTANQKTGRIRLGGIGGLAFYSFGATTQVSFATQTFIRNRGAANSQIGGASSTAPFGTFGAGAFPTANINTAADQDLLITGQLAVDAERLTLEGFIVELLQAG